MTRLAVDRSAGRNGPACWSASVPAASLDALWRRWRSGGDGNQLFAGLRAFARAVVRQLSRGVGDDVHEDIVQEAMLQIVRSASRFDGRAQLSTWVYSVVRNTVRQHHRRWRRPSGCLDRNRVDTDVHTTPDGYWLRPGGRRVGVRASGTPGQERWLWCTEALGVLTRAGLTLRQQLVVELYYSGEYDTPAIAARLGIPVSTVRTRLYYARRRLQEFQVGRAGTDDPSTAVVF